MPGTLDCVRLSPYIAGVLLALTACGQGGSTHATTDEAKPTVEGDTAAIATCEARTDYAESTLRAAYETTVAELAAWSDSRQPPDWGHVTMPYEKDHAGSDPISLCWLDDGQLAFPGPVRAARGRPRAAIVIDSEGRESLLAGGYFETNDETEFEIERPAG